MSEDRKYRDAEWLREQYLDKQHSFRQIAEKCGAGETTVREWGHKYGIPTRGPGAGENGPKSDKRYADEEWLREQYLDKRQSMYQIAEKCDTNESTVRYWVEKYEISTREEGGRAADRRLTDREWVYKKYTQDKKSTTDIAEICECTQVCVYRWLQRHDIDIRGSKGDSRLTDPEWLQKEYVEKGRSGVKIAEECDCSTTTVYRWLESHGIERQNNGVPSGEDHPLFAGGQVGYGPGWNDEKKRQVRERDEHTCQDPRCSVTQSEHLQERGEKLHVHHLRKARRVDDPEERNATENLITLCRDCHQRWEKIADAGLVPEIEGVAP